MKTIYLDGDFKCYLENDDTRMAVETEAFDGKCDEFILGYQYIPKGYTWVREDGEVFTGEMVAPWLDFRPLDEAQRIYDQEQLADMRQALAVLGVTLDA